MRKILILLVLTAMSFSLFSAGQQDAGSQTIVFADLSWDSVQVHNRIMGYIIENGLEGYTADYMIGDTVPTFNGIIQGDIDVDMESWHKNVPEIYAKGIASGDLIDLGKNLPDAPQGWWVPRYLVEGPDAAAPGLKSVKDLPKYAHLFKDPEDPSKGIVYAGVAGWGQLTTGEEYFETFGLHEKFNMGVAGSGTALAATMKGAYQKKEPWIGYYWAPTAIMGKLDMVLLPGTEYPPADVNILINKSMTEKASDVVEVLKKYKTTIDENNEFLAKMSDEGWDAAETAEWFLKTREDVWTKWVSSEVADKVKAALQG